jgi:hypothetical protein
VLSVFSVSGDLTRDLLLLLFSVVHSSQGDADDGHGSVVVVKRVAEFGSTLCGFLAFRLDVFL